MAVIIDERLTAVPRSIRLPRAVVDLGQKLHTDRDQPEPATITYSLDGRIAVFFETPGGGLAKSVEFAATIPLDPTKRSDRVVLVESGTTGVALIEIEQVIRAETEVFDAVNVRVGK